MKNGLILLNIGTPDAPDTASVRRYLREFLSDKRVIDLSAPLRYLILYAFILPFRPQRSAHAYQAVWTKEGSPLMTNSLILQSKLQKHLGENYDVVIGMRYGKPSIHQALNQLAHCEHITVLPLFPQYSSAATGSAIEKVMDELRKKAIFPSLQIIRDFHQHPDFISAQAAQIKPYLANHDYILFSYHGLPENHLKKGGCNPVCANACPSTMPIDKGCYRAQCLQTTSLLADRLSLTHYSSSFQSRLGRTPWIKPYTDFVLPELASKGIKRLAVACPSFALDCLETLEEIGIRAREQWLELGGETLTLIPCLNAEDGWIKVIASIIESHRC